MSIITLAIVLTVGVIATFLVAGIKYLGPITSINGMDEFEGRKISPFKRDYVLPTNTAIFIVIDLLFTLVISPFIHKTSEFERFLDWMGRPD